MLSPYKSLLIVEDDDNFREIVCWCLREEGYQVHGARNGAEALRLAREVKPEAIVLDLMMPVMDGWELLDELDRDPELAQIPRFVMTAAPTRTSKAELGAPVFKKPLDVDELVRALRSMGDDDDLEPTDDEIAAASAAAGLDENGDFAHDSHDDDHDDLLEDGGPAETAPAVLKPPPLPATDRAPGEWVAPIPLRQRLN